MKKKPYEQSPQQSHRRTKQETEPSSCASDFDSASGDRRLKLFQGDTREYVTAKLNADECSETYRSWKVSSQ